MNSGNAIRAVDNATHSHAESRTTPLSVYSEVISPVQPPLPEAPRCSALFNTPREWGVVLSLKGNAALHW